MNLGPDMQLFEIENVDAVEKELFFSYPVDLIDPQLTVGVRPQFDIAVIIDVTFPIVVTNE